MCNFACIDKVTIHIVVFLYYSVRALERDHTCNQSYTINPAAVFVLFAHTYITSD